MTCPRCGEPGLPAFPAARFCKRCGASLAPESASSTPAPAAAPAELILPRGTTRRPPPAPQGGPPPEFILERPRVPDVGAPPPPAVESKPAAQLRPAPPSAGPQAAPAFRYAGFWRRSFALGVDLALVWGLLILLTLAGTQALDEVVRRTVLDPEGRTLGGILRQAQLGLSVGSGLLVWLYFAGLEASPMQGTAGKRLFGVRVADCRGRRVALWRSTLRLLLKALSASCCLIGFLMVGMSRRKQGLHDMLTGTVLLRR